MGVVPTNQALNIARDVGMDLVEVSPTEKPPVCRIMDYGKHKYEKKKRLKQASRGHTVVLKEIRLRPKTDVHDLDLKINSTIKFLEAGSKVQFTMLFRGRERFNREFAHEVFQGIVERLGDLIKMERAPVMEGRRMTMLVSPSKTLKKAPAKTPVEPPKKPVEQQTQA
jgi:translation initiation factor IF-3